MASGVLLVFTRPPTEGLAKAQLEALALAAALAADLGGELACAVIGEDTEAAAVEAGERGVASLLVASSAKYRMSGDALVAAAEAAAQATEPRVVVIARGPDALELAPRLAARLGGASIAGASEVRTGDDGIEAVASVFGGAARAVYRFTADGPAVVSLAPVLLAAPAREPGRTADRVELEVAIDSRVRVIEAAVDSGVARIEDARVVVSAGRGLREAENVALVRDLAEALGGLPGASRAIVDDGWAPPSEQVGLTGAIVTPDLYIAVGISGASQHMAGCSNARVLVAINTDADAPFVRYAHFGIVDDALEVLPELIRLRRERSST